MNKADQFNDKPQRILQAAFVLLILLSLGSFAKIFIDGVKLNSDLLFMLPQDATSESNREVQAHVVSNFGSRFILGIEAQSSDDAEFAMEFLRQRLSDDAQFKIESFDESLNSFEAYADEIAAYRFNLLSTADRELLEDGKSMQLIEQARQSLYGFDQQPRWVSLQKDPLNLLGDFLVERLPAQAGDLIEDFLIVDRPPKHYAFIFLKLASDTFDMDRHDGFQKSIAHIESELNANFDNLRLIRSGLNFHVAEASGRARSEISLIAIGSTLAVTGLFLLAFGSVKPLLFALFSILAGCLSSFAITALVFEQVHIFTLIFGASLIGVAVDYALHHIVLLDPSRKQKQRSISAQSIRSASFLGMISTIIAYSFLTQSNLPGLQQIATFSAIGLAGSWLFVAVCYPFYHRHRYNTHIGVHDTIPNSAHKDAHQNAASLVEEPGSRGKDLVLAISILPYSFWSMMSKAVRISLIVVLLIGSFSIIGLYLTPSNSAIVLHKPSSELIENEMLVQELLKGISPNQYFLVKAETIDALLEIQERLSLELDQLIAAGALERYEMLGNYFPSRNRQLHNYNLLKDVYGEDGVALRLMDELGVDAHIQQLAYSDYNSASGNTISSEQIKSLAAAALSHIWLKAEPDQITSTVYLRKVSNKVELQKLAEKMGAVTFIDKVGELNSAIRQQFDKASMFLLYSLPLICLLLIGWHRRLMAGVIILVPMASCICTLALITILQTEISLFHIFGLYLVLGLGLDYAIFVYHAADSWKDCLRTIFLSSATSCASFGLLSLSSTPMIAAFGLTIFIGSVGNAIFSPLLLHFSIPETT